MENYDEIITNIKTIAADQGLDAVEAYVKEALGDKWPESVPTDVAEALLSLQSPTVTEVDPA